ncbi:MAG: PDDEXK nuclease domain-containing protein [Bacteroidales bacterium]|nr:PDDEXK nuclease domain-containing protein [Bacteroidales bacterium]
MPNNIETTQRIVHSHDVHLDTDYAQWLVELKSRYRSAQVKAAVKVNAEKLLFNWQLGRDLVIKKAEERWGTGVVEQVSLDLRNEFPADKGFSTTNLWYMKQWYEFYTTTEAKEMLRDFSKQLILTDAHFAQKLHQRGASSSDAIFPQLASEILQQPAGEISCTEKLQQPVGEFPLPLAFVPWSHHLVILGKCNTVHKALFYIRNVIAEGWSREQLQRAFTAEYYERQGPALNNFNVILPDESGHLASQITKSNYDFSFASVAKTIYDERELEDALCNNITQFLLELGNGFAFMGRQVEIPIAGKDRLIDLLFYHIRLRCYIVVELKVTPFEPEFGTKLNFYVNAVNRYVKHDDDNPTLGLLICSQFDKTEMELAFEGVTTPLGVATYNGIKVSDVLPSEEILRTRVRQLEQELRLSRKLIHNLTDDKNN